MIKRLVIMACMIAWVSPGYAEPATQTPPRVIGFDISIPYIVTVDGSSYNEVDHQELGLSLFHFINDGVSLGARISIDIEEDSGRFRQWIVAPGARYQWFQGRTWMPFVRFDFPIVLAGAFNNQGSDTQKDFGVIAGMGLAWNIGNQMGIKNVLLRYDFSTQYFFGFGNALGNFGIEFARFGLEYRF